LVHNNLHWFASPEKAEDSLAREWDWGPLLISPDTDLKTDGLVSRSTRLGNP